MKKIGILGRGTMAIGIAQIFAQSGNEVMVWVRSIDKGSPRASLAPLEKTLDRLVSRERITAAQMGNTLKNISITDSYEDLKAEFVTEFKNCFESYVFNEYRKEIAVLTKELPKSVVNEKLGGMTQLKEYKILHTML